MKWVLELIEDSFQISCKQNLQKLDSVLEIMIIRLELDAWFTSTRDPVLVFLTWCWITFRLVVVSYSLIDADSLLLEIVIKKTRVMLDSLLLEIMCQQPY